MRLTYAVPLVFSLALLFGCSSSDDDQGTNALTDAAGSATGPGGGGMRGGGGAITGGTPDGAAPDASPDMSSSETSSDTSSPKDVRPADVAVDTRSPDAPVEGPLDAPRDLPVDLPADLAPDMRMPPDAEADTCESCDTIAKQYTLALARARACNTLLKGQCSKQAASALTCGCPVWVNSTTELETVRGQWEASGCNRCAKKCPPVLCGLLTSGTCSARGTTDQPEIATSTLASPGVPPRDPVPQPGNKGTCENANILAPF